MKTNFFISVFALMMFSALLSGQASGQADATNFFTVSGTVKDANTNRPVAFAHVFIPETHIGTVANLDGFFTLKIDHSLKAESIGVSHLGYKVSGFKIENRKGKETEFLISPHSITLNEVLVKPHDPRNIVLEALEKKEENYTKEPHLLTGFYRETIKQRRNYISIAEAVINVYQAPARRDISHNQVKVVQGRKSADVQRADTLILKLQGGPSTVNVLDIVRNGNVIVDEESIDWYNYELLDIVKIEDESNYVIGFTPRIILPVALPVGKLYISTETKAITMASFSLDLSDEEKAAKSFIQRKPARLRFNPRNTQYLITYTKIDGEYHINYIRTELEFYADWRRRIFRTNYSVMMELAITKRETENVKRFDFKDVFRNRSVFADMVSVYFEEDFWGDYNYIEPDQSIESAIQKLNKKVDSE